MPRCVLMNKFALRSALILALPVAAVSAHANRVAVDGSPADLRLSVNHETVEKSGPTMALLWHVNDYSTVQSRDGKDFRS